MGPARNSPLSNPFYTAPSPSSTTIHSGPVRKSPRSSLSGKEGLGMIPSISSLRNQVDRLSSSPVARDGAGLKRSPHPLSSASAMALPISENDNPLGPKNATRRKSPRKLAKFASSSMDRLHDLVARRGLVDDEDGVEGTLSRQKALFAQRKRISAFADVGDTKSALHWLTRLIASDAALLHWSDQYRLFRIGLASGQPRKLLLEALLKLPECALLSAVSGGSRSNAMLCLLALELSEALGDWEGLLRGAEALERQLEEASPGDESSSLRWEREQFPAGWVPAADASVLRARVAFFRGRALRALGDFEAAIEAFSRATDHDPHAFSAVSELVDESNALIPAGQRKAYMGTLIIDDDPEPIAYDYSVDELFANGQYASVLQHTQPLFREPKALPLPDARLLVLHLGALLALRKANDLFALAHRLVDAVPQSGLPWYAVGLYYEAVGKFDDSRRYLMKACSKEEGLAAAWLMLGHSFSRSGDHDQAVSAYALLARHLAPASLSPRIFLGMEFLKTRQPGLATPYLLEAYNADPGNPWVLNELGLLYSLKKDYARALSSLSSASVLLAQQRARHPHADLLATVLGNLVAVRLKKIASGSTDGAAAMEDVMEAVLSAKEALHLPEDRQSTRMLNACAAAFELAFQLTGDLGCCAQAADLYFRVLQSSPGDKIANEGYKRSLVAKVQAAPIPPLDAEDAMEMDNDCTPANNDHGMDVESSPVSGPASMAAPSSLRRKLTTLSFARLEVGEAEVVLETPRPPGQEGDPDLDFRQHRRRHY